MARARCITFDFPSRSERSAGAPPLPTAPITAHRSLPRLRRRRSNLGCSRTVTCTSRIAARRARTSCATLRWTSWNQVESASRPCVAGLQCTSLKRAPRPWSLRSTICGPMAMNGMAPSDCNLTMPTNPTGKVSTAHPGTSSAIQWSTQDPRTKELVKDIAKWCVIDGRPAHMVEGEGWKAFCAKRFPEFPGVTDETISARMLEFNDASVQWFTSLLKTVSHVSVTTDGWTSDAKERYRTVTLSFFILRHGYLCASRLGLGSVEASTSRSQSSS